MNYLIRKYKISKILNQPLTGIEGEIIDFIQSWLKDLIPFKYDESPNSIFYMKEDGRYVLEQDIKDINLYIRYENFWSVLFNKYSLEYTDIQILLKFMVEEAFKKELSTPYFKFSVSNFLVEEAFKKELSTPTQPPRLHELAIEEAYKQQYNK